MHTHTHIAQKAQSADTGKPHFTRSVNPGEFPVKSRNTIPDIAALHTLGLGTLDPFPENPNPERPHI